MVAYSQGSERIRRLVIELAQEGDGWRHGRRNLWSLNRLRRPPEEGALYLPKVLAAAIVDARRDRGLGRGR
jgi:hypothetical protein